MRANVPHTPLESRHGRTPASDTSKESQPGSGSRKESQPTGILGRYASKSRATRPHPTISRKDRHPGLDMRTEASWAGCPSPKLADLLPRARSTDVVALSGSGRESLPAETVGSRWGLFATGWPRSRDPRATVLSHPPPLTPAGSLSAGGAPTALR
jgi:hypothetical protein